MNYFSLSIEDIIYIRVNNLFILIYKFRNTLNLILNEKL